MDHPYVINARFVTQPLTGVQRYCYELSSRLQGSPLLSPGPALDDYQTVRSRVIVKGDILSGHIWEQFTLPLMAPRRSVLFSPAGCGPLAHPNQVLTIHDIAPLENPQWYSRAFALWYSQLVPALSRRARKIVTVSAFCKRRIVEALGIAEEKVTVALGAVGSDFTPRLDPDVRQTLERLGIQIPFFLAVGAVSGRKNLPRLMNAWKRVIPRLDETTLVVVGKVGLRFSDKATPLGVIPERVTHIPSVNDQDLACLYTAAQGLLYPSLYEGFGLPILEAMACGCPVLTSNCAAMPEVAGDAALLVDPLSEDSIAGGIIALTHPSRANELRRRGLQRCRAFCWDHTAGIVKGALLN